MPTIPISSSPPTRARQPSPTPPAARGPPASLEPDPDRAAGSAGRRRPSELPRSSRADYTAKLISKGGGVSERSRKSIALSPEIGARLGLTAEKLTPAELVQAI